MGYILQYFISLSVESYIDYQRISYIDYQRILIQVAMSLVPFKQGFRSESCVRKKLALGELCTVPLKRSFRLD